MSHSASAEQLQNFELLRFGATELPEVARHKNKWGTTSLQFDNGDELLDSLLLHARIIDYRYPARNPDVLREVYLESSPVGKLNKALTAHIIARTILFESKIKIGDMAAEFAVEELASYAENYNYEENVEGLEDLVKLSVKEKKIFRTKSLLVDLQDLYSNLSYPDVWLRVHGLHDGTTRAAKLGGFALHGQADDTAIEPIVEVGEVFGLLPEDSYIDPYVSVRIER